MYCNLYKAHIGNAKKEMEKPFPQEDKLKEKLARLTERNILLDMDKKGNEIVDGDVEQEPEAPPRESRERER